MCSSHGIDNSRCYLQNLPGRIWVRTVAEPHSHTGTPHGHHRVHLLVKTVRSGAIDAHATGRTIAAHNDFQSLLFLVLRDDPYHRLTLVIGLNFQDVGLCVPLRIDYFVRVFYLQVDDVSPTVQAHELTFITRIKSYFRLADTEFRNHHVDFHTLFEVARNDGGIGSSLPYPTDAQGIFADLDLRDFRVGNIGHIFSSSPAENNGSGRQLIERNLGDVVSSQADVLLFL